MKKLLTVIIIFFSISFSYADTFIPVTSDVYNNLRRLEALGSIRTGQLTIFPLSSNEVRRLIKEAEENKKSTHVDKILEKIKSDLPGVDFKMTCSFEYKYIEDKSFFLEKNNSGVNVEPNSNLKLKSELYGNVKNFGIYASPYFLSNERYEKVSVNEAYALLNYKKLEFSFGKELQWWGGGRNGSILLSNNAEGLNVFKISNSTPFDFFIPFRFAFFFTKLENNRIDVKSPYMHGFRITLKPSAYVEIGLEKTALYGGRGRDSGVGAFLNSFVGNNEKNTTNDPNREPGDQRAGFDVKLISPNSIQPFTFYLQADAEDVRDDFPYPYKFAFIYSLYLPKVLIFDNLEFLIEHADTVFRQKNIWYNHHIFTQGYTYNGDIMGHYIGSDAKDWFLKARYNFDKANFDISYERLKNTLQNYVWEAYFIMYEHKIIENFTFVFESGLFKENKNKLLVGTGMRFRF